MSERKKMTKSNPQNSLKGSALQEGALQEGALQEGALQGKSILLVICGGIAAYKSLDLIRRLKEQGANVRCVMTESAQRFITPLSAETLSGHPTETDLWREGEGRTSIHIQLARQADVIAIAPATANFLAKTANGFADDLASAIVMAAQNVPILVAPAMNPSMADFPATRRNMAQLKKDGFRFIGPYEGEMAESGEYGNGRMADVPDIARRIAQLCRTDSLSAESASALEKPLAGKKAIVTSGATREAIDPVRYLSNRSSGRQGHAIAEQLALYGAQVILIHGAAEIEPPACVKSVSVASAENMRKAVEKCLPADIAIFAAAVADWRVKKIASEKKGKEGNGSLELAENPDILAGIGTRAKKRPELVIGFAAQTTGQKKSKKERKDSLLRAARAKRKAKGADWILANDVSLDKNVFGSEQNAVHLITESREEYWARASKTDIARRLVEKIVLALGD